MCIFLFFQPGNINPSIKNRAYQPLLSSGPENFLQVRSQCCVSGMLTVQVPPIRRKPFASQKDTQATVNKRGSSIEKTVPGISPLTWQAL